MENRNYIYFDVRNSKYFFEQEGPRRNKRIKPNFDLEKENGETIYGRELSYLGKGLNSTVWKYECGGKEYAIKIFFDIGLSCALSLDVYKVMRNLPIKNTLKALETLKVINDNENENAKRRRYYAYIMEYLEEQKNSSIVDMPTSILLENTSILESDAEILAKNNIVMQDLKTENTIFNKTNSMFYISDVDMFQLKRKDASIDDTIMHNYTVLQYIFYRFLTRYSTDYYNGIYNDLFEKLLYQDTTHEKSITDKLEDLFFPYDTPKQFFKDNKDRYYKKYFR